MVELDRKLQKVMKNVNDASQPLARDLGKNRDYKQGDLSNQSTTKKVQTQKYDKQESMMIRDDNRQIKSNSNDSQGMQSSL